MAENTELVEHIKDIESRIRRSTKPTNMLCMQLHLMKALLVLRTTSSPAMHRSLGFDEDWSESPFGEIEGLIKTASHKIEQIG